MKWFGLMFIALAMRVFAVLSFGILAVFTFWIASTEQYWLLILPAFAAAYLSEKLWRENPLGFGFSAEVWGSDGEPIGHSHNIVANILAIPIILVIIGFGYLFWLFIRQHIG